MATGQTSEIIRHLRAVLQEEEGVTDGELLERFVSRHDEAALTALVQRHGPMVWGVCHRVLGGHHDAEDAFQATFLVLVRKAASIRPSGMVGNWLYGVALQTTEARLGRTYEGTYEIDPEKKPKSLDVRVEEGANEGKTFRMIYKIDGDTLTICEPRDNDRPTEFTSKETGACRRLVVL